jgi:hypothetical protein
MDKPVIKMRNWKVQIYKNRLEGDIDQNAHPNLPPRTDCPHGRAIYTSEIQSIRAEANYLAVETLNSIYHCVGKSYMEVPGAIQPDFEAFAQKYNVPVDRLYGKG